MQKLALELTGAITGCLGLGPKFLGKKMEDRMQLQ